MHLSHSKHKEENMIKTMHYVIFHYLALAINTCLTLLMFTPLRDPCALPQILVSWASMLNYSHMVSILLPTMVPLHWIFCHSHSDINRNLIASSKLWKLICFLSINKFNISVVFCYFHLSTINTTLVINKLRHLSYYWH